MASNEMLMDEATDIAANAEQVLSNESLSTLDPNDFYSLAQKLERAANILLVLGDRKYNEINKGSF